MPRRSVLSASDRAALLVPSSENVDRIRLYTISETDLALIRQRRGEASRLCFAVQLCLLRYPGTALTPEKPVDAAPIGWVAATLWLDPGVWARYAVRDTTRRQHRQQLLACLSPLGWEHINLTGGYVWPSSDSKGEWVRSVAGGLRVHRSPFSAVTPERRARRERVQRTLPARRALR